MNLRIALFTTTSFLFAASCLGQSATKSPWLGVWTGRLGECGIVALRIDDRGTGQPAAAELWWLVSEIRLAGPPRIEDTALQLDYQDHRHRPAAGLAFRLVGPDQLRLTVHGVIPDPPGASLGDLILVRHPVGRNSNPWYDITNTHYKTSEWGKWHEHGQLKPLPPEWPSSVAVATALLLSSNVHQFHSALVQTNLPPEFMDRVLAMIQDQAVWADQKDHILLALAQNPNTSREALTKIWDESANPRLWIHTARHPHAPSEWSISLVERILQGGETIKIRAIQSGEGPAELYARLLPISPAMRQSLGGSRKMPAFVYETLFREHLDEYDLANTLARNESVPVSLLEELGRQPSARGVHYHLIANRSFPAESRQRIVQELAAAAHLTEFPRLASDRDAPSAFLRRCAADLDPQVRQLVARHANTELPVLLQLAEDDTRQVAGAARESLNKRAPAEWNARVDRWKPLPELIADNSPVTRFVRAAAQADRTTMDPLSDYLREKSELDGALSRAAKALLATRHTDIMDRLLELGLDRYGVALTDLAAESGGNTLWLKYFSEKGAFEKGKAARACIEAVKSGKLENLTGLLATGLDPNMPGPEGQTALHIAVLRRNLPALTALAKAGARSDIKDQKGLTALDYAVKLNLISVVRMLDTNGRHREMIRAFEKDHPPAPRSRFLGAWSNQKDGFNTMVLKFDADGTGFISGGMFVSPIGWKESGTNEASINLLLPEMNPEHAPTTIRLTLDPVTDVLTFMPSKGESHKMHRLQREP